MRGVDEVRGLALISGKFSEGVADAIDEGSDEAGMIVEGAELVDLRSASADGLLRVSDVLAILAASGVRTVGGR